MPARTTAASSDATPAGAEPQAIDAPLSIAATFLVLNVKDDPQSRATVRATLGATDDLIKTITSRDLSRGFTCNVGIGHRVWEALTGLPKPRELHAPPPGGLDKRHLSRFIGSGPVPAVVEGVLPETSDRFKMVKASPEVLPIEQGIGDEVHAPDLIGPRQHDALQAMGCGLVAGEAPTLEVEGAGQCGVLGWGGKPFGKPGVGGLAALSRS